MPSRAERRRAVLAERKAAKRSKHLPYPAAGVAPLPGSALVRARELWLQAKETGESHPYHDLTVAEIRKMEHERRPIPNRRIARLNGIRSGYARRLAARLAVAAQMRRLDAIEADPARLAAYKAKREAAVARAARRAARKAA